MSAELIYRTIGAGAGPTIRQVEGQRRAVRDRIVDWLADFNAKHPRPDGERREFVYSQRSGAIDGVTATADGKPPTGLRATKVGRFHVWVPRKGSKYGIECEQAWSSMRIPTMGDLLKELGMPAYAATGLTYWEAGAQVVDGRQVLVWWGSASVADQVDAALEKAGNQELWEKVPRSEYYAWLESQEAKAS